MAQAVSSWLPTVAVRIRTQVKSCGVFVVEKVVLGHVFSEYFGFPYQFSFHLLLLTDHLSSRAGTIGEIVAEVPSGLSLAQLQETKKKKTILFQAISAVPNT
jgi:hypothetical protein